jgi:nucleoid-associated protein YgaU
MNAALAGTLAVAPPVPPLTLHAGPDGRLSREHDPPPARPTTPTTATTPTTTPKPPRARAARQSRPPRRERPRQHRVESGDNLWTIARSELARRDGRAPADRDIAPYWFRVIAANRTTLRSGDPNLIFPGEIVILPNP